MLRIFFRYKRRLLGDLCQAAVHALLKYFQAATGTALLPGVVASVQTFGQKINLHAHLHFLVTEGGEDSEGRFHHLASFQDSLLADFFSREVFALLLREELISEAERVGKYMIRPLLSLQRLSLDEREAKVCYRYGEKPEEVERMDYLDFIARVTSHIPDKGQVTVRYYGIYANAHRGKVRKAQPDKHPFIIVEEESPRIPRLGWAEMIRKVFEADPLVCPRCQSRMHIIAFLTGYAVVDRIIDHLKLTFVAESPPPSHVAYQEVPMAAESSAEYFL
jgi:hypothetical protein